MFTKAILLSLPALLITILYWVCNNQLFLYQSDFSTVGLNVGIFALITILTGLIIFFKRRSNLSKTLSLFLVIGLLILLLSGAVITVLGSKDSEIVLTELHNNLPGESGYSIFQLSDGNYILNTANSSCTFLIKLDSNFNEIWTKTISIGAGETILSRLVLTGDGGFALAGVINNYYVLLKTDSQGNIEWNSTFTSNAPITYLRALIQTFDGGFALVGFGEPVEEGLGWIWFTKTDSLGNIDWTKSFSGPVADCPSAIIQVEDGGYMMADVSYSFVPDQGFFRLIRLDPSGNVLWNTTYGGEGYYLEPECNAAIATKDGGYLMVGYLWDTDAWVVKTDAEGNMQWNRTYGEKGSSIVAALETPNGNYLLASISNFHTAGLIMTDPAGNKLWNMSFPDVTWQIGYEANFNSLIQTVDNNYLMLGSKNQSIWIANLYYQKLPAIFYLLPIVYTILAATTIVITLITMKKQ